MDTLTTARRSTAATADPVARNRPRTATALGVATIIEGLTGIAGGAAFLMDTTGAVYTDDPSFIAVLEDTPIETFLLPGLFLLTVIGLVPLVSGWGVLGRHGVSGLRWLQDLTGHHWSWAVTITVGSALLAWMVVEIVVMGEIVALHIVYAVWGAVLVAGPLLPSVRRWLADAQVPTGP